jgi:hypothetical protein
MLIPKKYFLENTFFFSITKSVYYNIFPLVLVHTDEKDMHFESLIRSSAWIITTAMALNTRQPPHLAA